MPTFSSCGMLLPLRRPHEPSSRPPGGPSPGVRSRQVGKVAEEANEKTRLASRKGPRGAERSRISTPMITCIGVSYIYIYIYTFISLYHIGCTLDDISTVVFINSYIPGTYLSIIICTTKKSPLDGQIVLCLLGTILYGSIWDVR